MSRRVEDGSRRRPRARDLKVERVRAFHVGLRRFRVGLRPFRRGVSGLGAKARRKRRPRAFSRPHFRRNARSVLLFFFCFFLAIESGVFLDVAGVRRCLVFRAVTVCETFNCDGTCRGTLAQFLWTEWGNNKQDGEITGLRFPGSWEGGSRRPRRCARSLRGVESVCPVGVRGFFRTQGRAALLCCALPVNAPAPLISTPDSSKPVCLVSAGITQAALLTSQ